MKTSRTRSCLVLILAMAGAVALLGGAPKLAHATTVVSTCDNQTFRNAVAAETAGPHGAITFACSGTVNLNVAPGATTPIGIATGKTLVIDGAGQTVTLSGGNALQLFFVS